MEASKTSTGVLHSAVLERLAAREATRKLELAQSRSERHQLNGNDKGQHGNSSTNILLPPLKLKNEVGSDSSLLQRNTPGNFLENLYHAKSVILCQLQHLSETCLDDSKTPMVEKIRILDGILSQIEDLQRWFTESSAHLKSFHIEQARLELEEMKSKFQETKKLVLPKKKFTFGSKSSKKAASTTAPMTHTKSSPLKVAAVTCHYPQDPLPKYSLSNLSDRLNLRLPFFDECEDVLKDQSIYLSNLTRCTIFVEGVAGNIMANNLTECTIYAQPVASSILLQKCTNCRFVLACRQLRVHQTQDTRLDIFVASAPIIEDSTRLQLAPYPLGAVRSPKFQANLTKANLAEATNNWRAAQDFSCPTLLMGLGDGSMNWSHVPEVKWDQKDIPLCPYN